jgi:hypothetical protein
VTNLKTEGNRHLTFAVQTCVRYLFSGHRFALLPAQPGAVIPINMENERGASYISHAAVFRENTAVGPGSKGTTLLRVSTFQQRRSHSANHTKATITIWLVIHYPADESQHVLAAELEEPLLIVHQGFPTEC